MGLGAQYSVGEMQQIAQYKSAVRQYQAHGDQAIESFLVDRPSTHAMQQATRAQEVTKKAVAEYRKASAHLAETALLP